VVEYCKFIIRNRMNNKICKSNNEYYIKIKAACYTGIYGQVKYEHQRSKDIDIHIHDEELFRIACGYGVSGIDSDSLKIIKYFINYSERQNRKINIHVIEDDALYHAYIFNLSDVINYLIYLGKHNYKQYSILNYKYNCIYYDIMIKKQINGLDKYISNYLIEHEHLFTNYDIYHDYRKKVIIYNNNLCIDHSYKINNTRGYNLDYILNIQNMKMYNVSYDIYCDEYDKYN